MYRAFLSLRYIRVRRTNLVGIVGILVAVAALILILSIMTGFLEQSRRMVRGSLSDIVIAPAGSLRPDGRRLPPDPEPLIEVARADPRVQGAAPHLVWYGVLDPQDAAGAAAWSSSQPGSFGGAKLIGIDVPQEFAATDLLEALQREPRHGRRVADPLDPFAREPGAPPSVVLGDQLLERYGLQPGGEVEITTARPERGEWRERTGRFRVAGTFRSGENQMDQERVYFDRRELAEFLDADVTFTEVLVKLDDYRRDGAAVSADLFEALDRAALIAGDPREVRSWEDYRRVLLGAIRNQRALMGILLCLVLLVASFTVFAILSMMVSEKRRDIGILAALGATPRGIRGLFLLIAFWDALLGAVLGTAAGWWAAAHIDDIERWLSHTFHVKIFDHSVYPFDFIPALVQPGTVVAVVLGTFLTALVFAALPAWKASRLDPLDALRYD